MDGSVDKDRNGKMDRQGGTDMNRKTAPSPSFMSTPLVSLSPREIKSVSFPADARLSSTSTASGSVKGTRDHTSSINTAAPSGPPCRRPPRSLDIAKGRKPFKANHELFKLPPSGLASSVQLGQRSHCRPSSSSTTSPTSPSSPAVCGSPALPPRHPLKPNNTNHHKPNHSQGHHHNHHHQHHNHCHQKRRNSLSSGDLSDLARDSGYGSSVTTSATTSGHGSGSGSGCVSDNDVGYNDRGFLQKPAFRPRSASATRSIAHRECNFSLQQQHPHQHFQKPQSSSPASVSSSQLISSSISSSPSSTLNLPPPPPSLLVTPPESPTTDLPPPPPPPLPCSESSPSNLTPPPSHQPIQPTVCNKSYRVSEQFAGKVNDSVTGFSSKDIEYQQTQRSNHLPQEKNRVESSSKKDEINMKGLDGFISLHPQEKDSVDKSNESFPSKNYTVPPPRYEDALKRVSMFRTIVGVATDGDRTPVTSDQINADNGIDRFGAEKAESLCGDKHNRASTTVGEDNQCVSLPASSQGMEKKTTTSLVPMQNGYVGLNVRQFEARAVAGDSPGCKATPSNIRTVIVTSSQTRSKETTDIPELPPRPSPKNKFKNGLVHQNAFENRQDVKQNGYDVTSLAHDSLAKGNHNLPGFSREDSQISDEVFLTDDNFRETDDIAVESSESFRQAKANGVNNLLASRPTTLTGRARPVSASPSRREAGSTNLQGHERKSKKIILEVLV
ncbi:hypothetical protein PoB_002197300 [Plakobranchus ocellatus]|uniref:Uncharacterized protein n=1 Tax=Plakobranchus ocellatus TaxID=259542 RepID=A0AAV3ZLY3_9GAST|nr:hypothetical protein PoB_002197300 [Plakobranchus ocellatus]